MSAVNGGESTQGLHTAVEVTSSFSGSLFLAAEKGLVAMHV